MSGNRTKVAALGAVALGLVFAGIAICQEAGGPAAGGKAAARGRGNFDPAQIRQAMNDRIKQSLGATDEEWSILAPKVEKVQTLQRQMRIGGMGFAMARGGRDPRGGDPRGGQPGAGEADRPAPAAQDQGPVAKAADALAKLLQAENASAEEISAALQALRDARAKAKADLEAAQKELRDLLTVKQEAQLVMSGLLE